jgi:copper chaperone CopZ
MTHTYHITGMTCEACIYKVQYLLAQIDGVEKVTAEILTHTATIEMSRHIPLATLQAVFADTNKYSLSENPVSVANIATSKPISLATYKPILLIFAYILGICSFIQWTKSEINPMEMMQHFMAGFFLVFSFFKLLDIRAFANSYSSYDIVARKWLGWGFVYPFVELGLGLAYLTNCCPFATNLATFLVMGVSIMGVIQSFIRKSQIQCACLGTVFQLPMSFVTIIEDGLMILMSGLMLIFN